MEPDVPIDRVREVRAERRMLGLVPRQLGLRRERKVAHRPELAHIANPGIGDLAAIEDIGQQQLRKSPREAAPLRRAALVVAPGLGSVERPTGHRFAEFKRGLWYYPAYAYGQQYGDAPAGARSGQGCARPP